ncbi:nodulation protein NfeD [Aliiglaciecola sp. CAU 1673]|uniref:NfeD family protein n=1 Tax=Aliiglaciecola sp. CAU 1673 TaxID=3032595 RepID=UPI0023D98FB2|nr:nodulation protein NfeD [Aliiglaciecola sp. CAU 1673]MDF2176679.1 nodulation protein NfeD [Aliiglaciecola sp. CAU 1673]
MNILRRILLSWLLLISGICKAEVWVLDIRDAIGVATAEYVISGLDAAHQAQASLVVLRMDTPGGLDQSMRAIIQGILASEIPVVGFVAPKGARAASAGTYILYASHLAAMAPATTLGAATPVQIGGGQPASPSGQDQGKQPASAMERKILNDAIAYIQGLAELRQRNKEWAAAAVRDAASLSAQDALEQQVINVVAEDLPALLNQLDGQKVVVHEKPLTLSLAGQQVRLFEASWRHQFLSVLTNPNVAYILMLLGIYGLIFEFSNPGMGGPGIVGGICILLALYAFQVLPVNYAGVAMIALGVGLMIAEAVVPSFGILGIGGAVALVMGSIMLMDTPHPDFQIAYPLIGAVVLASAAFTFLTIGMLIKTRRNPVVSGAEHLLGAEGEVEQLATQGVLARVDGELWEVRCRQPLAIGDKIKVRSIDGLVLEVEKTKGKTDE